MWKTLLAPNEFRLTPLGLFSRASSNCGVDFHSAIKIRIDGMEGAVEHIIELVRRLPCTSVDLDDVELALTEALANAVVHGNRRDPCKSVQICGGCERS